MTRIYTDIKMKYFIALYSASSSLGGIMMPFTSVQQFSAADYPN